VVRGLGGGILHGNILNDGVGGKFDGPVLAGDPDANRKVIGGLGSVVLRG